MAVQGLLTSSCLPQPLEWLESTAWLYCMCCCCAACTSIGLQAQRLAAAEALIKMQAPGYPGAGPSDMEGRVKRLAADVKLLKDRLALAEAAAADGLASRPAAQVRPLPQETFLRQDVVPAALPLTQVPRTCS